MLIDEFLDIAHVHVGVRVPDKPTLLSELAKLSAPAVGIAPQQVEAALAAREVLGSTGLGDGIALPHARIQQLDRTFGLLCTLKRPISFEAVDDQPVDLVFLLLLPSGATGAHLGALAAVARSLRDPEVASGLRRARSALEAYAIVCKAMMRPYLSSSSHRALIP